MGDIRHGLTTRFVAVLGARVRDLVARDLVTVRVGGIRDPVAGGATGDAADDTTYHCPGRPADCHAGHGPGGGASARSRPGTYRMIIAVLRIGILGPAGVIAFCHGCPPWLSQPAFRARRSVQANVSRFRLPKAGVGGTDG